MEFRVFKFKIIKGYESLDLLRKDFEKDLETIQKKFLSQKAKVIDEEEQIKEKVKREKVYELRFKNYLEGVCKNKFFSANTMTLCFYTEKEDKKNGIFYSFKRYSERDVCSKSPPEVLKKFYFWFKNQKEGIVFANGGNPKATEFILSEKIPTILPIKIEKELKYSNLEVTKLFQRLRRENIVSRLNDIQVSVKISGQSQSIYKTIVFQDVGSFEYFDMMASKYPDMKIDKFSTDLKIISGGKEVRFIFRSRFNLYPIYTSLKSRAFESYASLFEWLGKILNELPS